ncbi:MAG: response regulator transcription factor [Rhodospirillaceae bacterium]
MRLLLVENDSDIAAMATARLAGEGFAVDVACSAPDVQAALAGSVYDAVVLDLKPSDGSMLDVLRGVRDSRTNVPVIVLTSRAPVEGADGASPSRPFSLEELVARIGTVLRRPGAGLGMRLQTANLVFDPATREVRVGDETLVVPRRELAALELLMQQAGRVVTKEALETAIYSKGEETDSNAIESHLSRLRKRLREAEAGVAILGVRGVGYMFRAAGAS